MDLTECESLVLTTIYVVSFACTLGLARFCESIIDYVANAENAPYPDITSDRFHGEISAAFDVLFNVWIKSNESKVIINNNNYY